MIELLAVLAIVGSVSGIGAARYLDFNERQVLAQAALNLKSNISLTQHRSLSGEKDSTRCMSTRQLQGWCFSPNTGVDDYSVYGVCGDPGVPVPGDLISFPVPIQEYNLPSGVTLTTASFDGSTWVDGGGKILFQPLAAGIRFAKDSITEVRYCLRGNIPSLGTKNIYRIRITKSGEIIDEGIQTVCY